MAEKLSTITVKDGFIKPQVKFQLTSNAGSEAMQTLVAAAVALYCLSGSLATLITLINQCPYDLTTFPSSGRRLLNKIDLGASGSAVVNSRQPFNVGASFPAGLIFASRTGSQNKAQVRTLRLRDD